jgi:hypothetical protein
MRYVCRSYSPIEHFCGERTTFGPPNVLRAFKKHVEAGIAYDESKART